ncbi:hypothetical protein RJT34_09283 [Clitoria ternatea]|uniref:Uncharacterized protein n=1 Tax=Clitoria ternatea TaxID=43366 RepID=A0AAN9K5L8_CLITE
MKIISSFETDAVNDDDLIVYTFDTWKQTRDNIFLVCLILSGILNCISLPVCRDRNQLRDRIGMLHEIIYRKNLCYFTYHSWRCLNYVGDFLGNYAAILIQSLVCLGDENRTFRFYAKECDTEERLPDIKYLKRPCGCLDHSRDWNENFSFCL